MNEKQLDLALLEDRILFDVAPLDAQSMEPAIDSVDIDSDVDLFNWAEASHSNDSLFADSQIAVMNAQKSAEQQLDTVDTLLEAEIDSDIAINIAAEYKQLIVVDQGVDNYMDLIDAAIGSNPPEQFEIMLIDSSESALQRINERLAETSYSAIHLVAHGADGELFIGNEVWNQSFIAENASGFNAWNQNLSEGADLLIYGCDLAESEHGVAFVEELSQLTGTDVAASTDLTGASELGGDWDLELQTGSIEHSVLFDAVTDSYWAGLLNVATAGGDSVTTGGLNGGTTDAVAIAADGDYVVTWTQETASNGAEIYAQMFNSDGTAKASAFLVNETSSGDQEYASVASDASGNFVIVWTDTTADEVYMKRYASDGSVLAGESEVDKQSKGITVAMNNSGQFVVAWEEVHHEHHLKAETYDVDGSKIKNKFTVNSNDDENVSDVAVDMNSNGDFAVSWTRDVTFDDIYVASFDIDGDANFSGDVKVADINFVGMSHSDVSINDSGDLAVSFTSSFGSRFANVRMVNSDGTLGNFYGPVSDITSGDQTDTSIKLSNNGDFVVAWEGNGVGDSGGIHGKIYNAALDQFSAEITANLYTTGDQSNASFDFNAAGDFVLVYSGDGPSGSTIFVTHSLNSPPTGTDSTIQASEDVSTPISLDDFGYADNEGDPFIKVKILSLPADGTLRLNGVAVSLNDEIPASAISSNQLTFEPNTGFAGEASFSFQVHDENNSAIDPNTLTINVHEDIEITIDEDTNHTFVATDFSSVLTIDHVKIFSLPQNGTLTLSGSAVTVGQTISKSDLDAGDLVFAPDENQFGTPYDSFEFRIFDGAEYTDVVSTASILQTDFSSNASDFSYVDDVFGTNEPTEASGSYDGSAGNGGGALVVDLGPHDTGNAVSGGWTRSINLAEDSVVRITVQHRTQFAGETDDGEYVEAVLEVNGVRYGSGAGSSLNRINGVGGNGADHDSGWQTSVIEVQLDAGANTITLGGYNNRLTLNNEWGKVSFDNLEIETLTFSDFEINVNSVNDRPTDIALDNLSVNENAAGAIIGNLTATDPDVGDGLTLTVDHSDFEVVSGQLKLKDGVALNHEAGSTVSVQITAEDNGGLQRIETFTITVDDINEAPTALTLAQQPVDENAAGAVLGAFSFSDPDDGDSHSVTLSDNRFEIVGGNLRLKAGLSLDHEVDNGMTLSVTATDVGGLTANQDFTITVNNVNESPTGITLNYLRINENSVGGNVGTVSVADPDVGDSHTYLLSDNRFEIVGNQLKLKAGEVLNHEVEDEVQLTITATDVAGESVDVDFTISVDDLNESPYNISVDNLVVSENAVNANIGSISSSDQDDGDSVTYTVSDNRFEVINGSLLRLKSGQSLDFEVDPTVSITVTATDSGLLTNSENFTITVSDIDESATAHAFGNSYSVTEDDSVGGNLINDNTGSGADYGFGAIVMTTTPTVPPSNGTVVLLSDGNFSYSPDLDFAGSDSFQYEITDANGAVSTASVNITVTPVNDTPEITGMTNLNVAENSIEDTLVGTVQIDDPDLGDTFTYSLVDSADNRFSVNSDGELRVADGSRLDFEDLQSHSIEVRVEDAAGAFRTETFTIAVLNVNELPNAVNDTAVVTEEQSVIISVADLMSNDSDPDGFGTISFDGVGNVANGTLTDNGNNTFTYTPNVNFFGNDSFQYTIRDAGGQTSSATVSITVDPVNDTPIAHDDSFNLMEGGTLVMTGSVFSNDVDYDGDTLSGNLLTGPQHGTIEWNTDGTFRYVHDGSETTSDQFTYTVLDPSGESDTATVSLSVASVNDAPVAVGETATVEGNETAEVEIANLLRNDSDAEGSDLSFEIVGRPANGTVTIENGRLVYTPNPGFNGLEQIFYRVSDGELFSETVAINITVNFTSFESETAAAFARTEEVVVEEDVVIAEKVEEVEEVAEIVEFTAIISTEDDDEASLEQLGRLAQTQGTESELGLRSASEDEEEESYRFISNLKSSSFSNSDSESYSRFRVASDREFEGVSTSTFDIQTAEQFDFSHLSQDLDNFDHSFDIDGSVDQVTFATLSSITGALTVGYVLWMVRGGMLMASFVSSIPAWQSVDPLNIVEFGSIGGGDADEESLESIVTQFSSQA